MADGGNTPSPLGHNAQDPTHTFLFRFITIHYLNPPAALITVGGAVFPLRHGECMYVCTVLYVCMFVCIPPVCIGSGVLQAICTGKVSA
jgi:hypothetical protein